MYLMLPELVTARLDLRPATQKDLDILWTLWTDPEVRRFLWDDVSISRERAAEALSESLAQSSEGLGLGTVRTRNDGRFVGCAGMIPTGAAVQFQPSLAGTVEPLIALAPAVWHQGYATEALERVIQYAFLELAHRSRLRDRYPERRIASANPATRVRGDRRERGPAVWVEELPVKG